MGKKGVGPSFFLSPFVFQFVHFLMDNVNGFWFEVAPNWEMSHPRWHPRTTLFQGNAKRSILVGHNWSFFPNTSGSNIQSLAVIRRWATLCKVQQSTFCPLPLFRRRIRLRCSFRRAPEAFPSSSPPSGPPLSQSKAKLPELEEAKRPCR